VIRKLRPVIKNDLTDFKSTTMKKRLLFFSALLLGIFNEVIAQHPRLAIHSYATRTGNNETVKPQFNMGQFIGRWQETARMRSGTKENVAVEDTLYLHFYKDNTADTKEGNSLVITGGSEIFTDNFITTSATDFRIVSVTPNKIVLDDLMGYHHELTKTKRFFYEATASTNSVPPISIDGKIDLSPSSIINNWFAYRRGAKPGAIKSGEALIRYLRIKENTDGNNYKGEIEFARNGEAFVQPCKITVTERSIYISTEGATWNMELYKADGREITAGKKGELVYYFKNIGQ
jgi:hypothetical protein